MIKVNMLRPIGDSPNLSPINKAKIVGLRRVGSVYRKVAN